MDSESTFDSFTNTRASSIINYYLDKSDTTSLDAVTCTECSDGCKTCTNNLACTAC